MEHFTLGLNFFGGHDTAIFAIFDDDVYGLSQERVTRIKHDSIFPIDAIKEMIRYKKINPNFIKQIDVAVATKAFQKRVFNQYAYKMTTNLRKLIQKDKKHLFIKDFVKGKKEILNHGKMNMIKTFMLNKYGREYLWMKKTGKRVPLDYIVEKTLKEIFPNAKIDITFYEHHLTHAYSTYYLSGFKNSLVFTLDGEGDGYFSKLYEVNDGDFRELGSSKNIFVENMKKYDFADSGYASIGNIYSIFTYLLGYTPNADEGKVEALAAFGNHNTKLYENLINSVSINAENLSMQIDTKELNKLFDKENIKTVLNSIKREDIAASVQKATENITLDYLTLVKQKHPSNHIAIAGGVTANVILNMKIFEELFDNIYVTPPMGDDGIALGSALIKYQEKGNNLENFKNYLMPYFGSSYTKDEVKYTLEKNGLSYEDLGDKAYKEAAKLIVNKKIGAIFQNRAEFGPRALGNRSIIADVRDKNIQKIINKDIKNRPLFQPFCPSILIEEKDRLFEKSYDNKHMTIAFKLKEKYKDEIPGAVHVDNTARVQFVSQEDNPNYYELISEVKKATGFGVIINTSFNKHGRTMVLSPQDAIDDFKDTNLDFMIIEGLLVQK